MVYTIKLSCEEIEWDKVCDLLLRAGLASHSQEVTRKAFENSYLTVFIFANHQLIGTGRAISDGVRQSAIYDIAVLPEYQGKGVGTIIIKELVAKLSSGNIIFYANPSAEGFYKKLGFRKMRTGMAMFANPENALRKGFVE